MQPRFSYYRFLTASVPVWKLPEVFGVILIARVFIIIVVVVVVFFAILSGVGLFPIGAHTFQAFSLVLLQRLLFLDDIGVLLFLPLVFELLLILSRLLDRIHFLGRFLYEGVMDDFPVAQSC